MGAYRVEGTLGAGSMGEVYKGVDTGLNRRVAIKILSEKHRDSPELRQRFVREGRAVAAISHPNVVQVFATGSFDERPYIAMELLDGTDLGSAIEKRGPLDSLVAAHAILDAAQGLAAAAKAGLIHRDVKPSNLVRLSDGRVKVTDFGLAKPVDPGAEPALTAMGVVVGTPDYIAPEQARGEAIDERVDIYALGGTLYYLLTGDPPFRTGNPNEDKYLKVVARHLKEPAPDVRSKNPSVDSELAALCRRMMAKKPPERPGYPELIKTLSAIVDRLQAFGPSALPAVTSASLRAAPDPTPFVAGRAGPRAADVAAAAADEEAAATLVRRSERPDAAWAQPTPRSVDPRARGGDGAGDGDGPVPVARWLLAVTAISALIFVVGLGLVLFGPRPAADGRAGAAIDAGGLADAGAAVPDPAAKPPEGMFLVKRSDGSPWLFVARAPVSQAEYAAAGPPEAGADKPPRGKKQSQPAVGVSYADAESFAAGRGMRLLTPSEWAAAAAADEFTPPGKGLWEWVDDGTRGVQALRAVKGEPDRTDRLRPVAHANVTFRLARDL